MICNIDDAGVSHEDELIYLFSNSAFSALNKTETTFSKQMIAVWTNFVKQRYLKKKNASLFFKKKRQNK